MAFAPNYAAVRFALILAALCGWSATALAVQHVPANRADLDHVSAGRGLAHGLVYQPQTKDLLRVNSGRNPFLIQRRPSLASELDRLLRTVGISAPAKALPQPSGAASSTAAGEPWLDPGNVLELP